MYYQEQIFAGDRDRWKCQFYGRMDSHWYEFNLYRHRYHEINISFDSETDSWFGTLRVSSVDDGPYGEMGDHTNLSKDLVAKLVKSFNLKDMVLEYMNDV